MVPAPRVFQFSCLRLSTLFRATTLLPPRSMRSTAGCQWSYLVAQPGLVTSRQTSVLSCNNLSSLLSTKPWYESEVETLTEEEIKQCLLHLIELFAPFCQYDTVSDCQ